MCDATKRRETHIQFHIRSVQHARVWESKHGAAHAAMVSSASGHLKHHASAEISQNWFAFRNRNEIQLHHTLCWFSCNCTNRTCMQALTLRSLRVSSSQNMAA